MARSTIDPDYIFSIAAGRYSPCCFIKFGCQHFRRPKGKIKCWQNGSTIQCYVQPEYSQEKIQEHLSLYGWLLFHRHSWRCLVWSSKLLSCFFGRYVAYKYWTPPHIWVRYVIRSMNQRCDGSLFVVTLVTQTNTIICIVFQYNLVEYCTFLWITLAVTPAWF